MPPEGVSGRSVVNAPSLHLSLGTAAELSDPTTPPAGWAAPRATVLSMTIHSLIPRRECSP